MGFRVPPKDTLGCELFHLGQGCPSPALQVLDASMLQHTWLNWTGRHPLVIEVQTSLLSTPSFESGKKSKTLQLYGVIRDM